MISLYYKAGEKSIQSEHLRAADYPHRIDIPRIHCTKTNCEVQYETAYPVICAACFIGRGIAHNIRRRYDALRTSDEGSRPRRRANRRSGCLFVYSVPFLRCFQPHTKRQIYRNRAYQQLTNNLPLFPQSSAWFCILMKEEKYVKWGF